MVVKKVDARAAKARARMAKRARRDRWIKANKKRILMIAGATVLILAVGFFSPIGPDYYYSTLQNRKMSAPDTMAPGYIEGVYKLGVFYNSTFRESDALRCYDEVGLLYFGHRITDYASNPSAAQDRRDTAEDRKKKNLAHGPPFTIPSSEIKYVGNAIWRVGEIIQKTQSRQFVVRIWKDLYMDELVEEHPGSLLDDRVTGIIKGFTDRFAR
ncbi:MAG: hypothetical protein FWG74_09375 [Planctomycetes bacterium]|nr:hypothetical protein [Planctomycetota bacterium]